MKSKLHFDANWRHNLCACAGMCVCVCVCVCVERGEGRHLNYLRLNCRTQQSGEIEGVSLLPPRQLSKAGLHQAHTHTHTHTKMHV